MDKYYVGLDGGSTYLKAALLKDNQVVDTMICNTGIDNSGAAEQLLLELCSQAGISRDSIRYIMATGYSRKILEVADDDISEITAHAYGVRVTAPKGYRPIGGNLRDKARQNARMKLLILVDSSAFLQGQILSLPF